MKLYLPTEKLNVLGYLHEKVYEALDSREISGLIDESLQVLGTGGHRDSDFSGDLSKDFLRKFKLNDKEIDLIIECSSGELFLSQPRHGPGPQVADSLQNGIIVERDYNHHTIENHAPNIIYIPYIDSTLLDNYLSLLSEEDIADLIIQDITSGRYGENLDKINTLLTGDNKDLNSTDRVFDFTTWYLVNKIPTDCLILISKYVSTIRDKFDIIVTKEDLETLGLSDKVKTKCAEICRDYKCYSAYMLQTNSNMLLLLDGDTDTITLPKMILNNIYGIPIPGDNLKDLSTYLKAATKNE